MGPDGGCSEAPFCCWWPQNLGAAKCGQCGTEWGQRKYLPGTTCPSSDGRTFETGDKYQCRDTGTWCEGGAPHPVPTPAPTMGPDGGCSEAPFCCWWPQNLGAAKCGQCGTEWGNRKYLPGTTCPSRDGRPFETGEKYQCQGTGTWCEGGAPHPVPTPAPPHPVPTPTPTMGPDDGCSEAPFCCWWPQNLGAAQCGQCGSEWGNRKYLPGTTCPSSNGRPFET